MKRLNVIVSDAAHKAVRDYQETHGIGTRDEAVDKMILASKKGIGAKKA